MGDNVSASQTASDRTNPDDIRRRNAPAEEFQPSQDFVQYLKHYARARPEVAALWCFGIGFVLGWKLKLW